MTAASSTAVCVTHGRTTAVSGYCTSSRSTRVQQAVQLLVYTAVLKSTAVPMLYVLNLVYA